MNILNGLVCIFILKLNRLQVFHTHTF